jgi:hypothetical protein
MSITRFLPRGRPARLVSAATLATALAIGSVTVFTNAESAGAAGTTHHLVAGTKQNSSTAREGMANATFTCNDATGAFKVAVRNVQVIRDDRMTPWQDYFVQWQVNGDYTYNVGLTQNTTNGLFGGTAAGYLPNHSDCATGVTFTVKDLDQFTDVDHSAWLSVEWRLS